jgi:phage terminase small subunit
VEKPKKKQNQPKTHAPKSKAVAKARRRKIVNALLNGKTEKQAGIEAGLNPNTAESQVSKILKEPQTKKCFAALLESSGVTDEFLSNKIKNLCDAKETVFFQKDGMVTDQREVEALGIQRQTIEMAVKLKGHMVEKVKVEGVEDILKAIHDKRGNR